MSLSRHKHDKGTVKHKDLTNKYWAGLSKIYNLSLKFSLKLLNQNKNLKDLILFEKSGPGNKRQPMNNLLATQTEFINKRT